LGYTYEYLEVSDITEDLVPGAFLAGVENPNRVNKIMALVFPIRFFPFDRIVNKPGYLNVLLLSREEHLVQILAHEFRHMW
jgi:hypothetical protein